VTDIAYHVGCDTKVCTKCKIEKPLSDFSPRNDSPLGVSSHCYGCKRKQYHTNKHKYNKRKRTNYSNFTEEQKQSQRDATKRYRAENKEYLKTKSKEDHHRIKEEVIFKYGGKCECCKEERLEFLSIDHIKGNGAEERKKIGTKQIYKKLLKSEMLTDEYRVLCFNCNLSLGFFGYCPHDKEKDLCHPLMEPPTNFS
jgi:hypothetical protein